MILSVHAPCNNSGKTRLAVELLRAFPQLVAAKVSTIYRDGGNGCLQKPGDPCSCTQLGKAPYAILDDPAIVAQPDTDTGRFVATGAPTWWMLCRPGTHAEAWALLRERLPEGRPVLLEGSRIADVCEPDLRIMIVNPHRPRSSWKATALEELERADLVVANPYGEGDADPEILDLLRTHHAVQSLDEVRERVARALAEHAGR